MQALSRFWTRLFPNDTQEAISGAGSDVARPLLASLMSMAWFVEARDPYTGGHLWRVSRFADLLAREAGMDTVQAARLSLGGFLHDIGKIGVPDAILRKPGKLTPQEWEVMQTHPDIGLRMLSGHPLRPLVQDAIHLHHERPDGQGYPLRMNADQIPLVARVVGLCDAFDAMTSQRPYRPGMPEAQALKILKDHRGTQFDADLVDRFTELGQRGELSHIVGHSDDGIPLQTCPMCGPTLVVRREQRAQDRLYCRNCAGEFRLIPAGALLKAEPTGAMGNAADLEPDVDIQLIERTITEALNHLPAADLMATLAAPASPSKTSAHNSPLS